MCEGREWVSLLYLPYNRRLPPGLLSRRRKTALPTKQVNKPTSKIQLVWLGLNALKMRNIFEMRKTNWFFYTVIGKIVFSNLQNVFVSKQYPLLTDKLSYLRYNTIERGLEAISRKFAVSAGNCLLSTFKLVLTQMRTVTCKKGYCVGTWNTDFNC